MVREPADFSSLAPLVVRKGQIHARHYVPGKDEASAPRNVKEETVIRRVYPLRGKSRHSELISQGQIFRLISLASSRDTRGYTLFREATTGFSRDSGALNIYPLRM